MRAPRIKILAYNMPECSIHNDASCGRGESMVLPLHPALLLCIASNRKHHHTCHAHRLRATTSKSELRGSSRNKSYNTLLCTYTRKRYIAVFLGSFMLRHQVAFLPISVRLADKGPAIRHTPYAIRNKPLWSRYQMYLYMTLFHIAIVRGILNPNTSSPLVARYHIRRMYT